MAAIMKETLGKKGSGRKEDMQRVKSSSSSRVGEGGGECGNGRSSRATSTCRMLR
jgi:hypothetical protein